MHELKRTQFEPQSAQSAQRISQSKRLLGSLRQPKDILCDYSVFSVSSVVNSVFSAVRGRA